MDASITEQSRHFIGTNHPYHLVAMHPHGYTKLIISANYIRHTQLRLFFFAYHQRTAPAVVRAQLSERFISLLDRIHIQGFGHPLVLSSQHARYVKGGTDSASASKIAYSAKLDAFSMVT